MSGLGSIFKSFAAAGTIAAVMGAHEATANEGKIPVPKKRPDIGELDKSSKSTNKIPNSKKRNSPFSGPAYMHFGVASKPLAGHADFCNRLPSECDFRSSSQTAVRWDAITAALVDEINSRANHTIEPETDKNIYGKDDYWNFPAKIKNAKPGAPDLIGDCEDYVLFKMKELEQIGVPKSAMSIVVVMNGDEGHAVLALRTDEGDKILNNLTDDILFPPETGLKFVKAVSFVDHKQWRDVKIDTPGTFIASLQKQSETYKALPPIPSSLFK